HGNAGRRLATVAIGNGVGEYLGANKVERGRVGHGGGAGNGRTALIRHPSGHDGEAVAIDIAVVGQRGAAAGGVLIHGEAVGHGHGGVVDIDRGHRHGGAAGAAFAVGNGVGECFGTGELGGGGVGDDA